jgi:hypothetical protein
VICTSLTIVDRVKGDHVVWQNPYETWQWCIIIYILLACIHDIKGYITHILFVCILNPREVIIRVQYYDMSELNLRIQVCFFEVVDQLFWRDKELKSCESCESEFTQSCLTRTIGRSWHSMFDSELLIEPFWIKEH